MTSTVWRHFDPNRSVATAPINDVLVWIREDQCTNGVTVGYFDGSVFKTWQGLDAGTVSAWAPLIPPSDPGPSNFTRRLVRHLARLDCL